ncbi:MAG: hypothetical protein ACI88H_004006 [Cocleimonas sp.]|jgi:hypothetical protein
MKKLFKRKYLSGIVIISLFLIAVGIIFLNSKPINADSTLPIVTVYKTPTCGCCKKWIRHLQSNGFIVKTKNLNSLRSIKEELGIEPKFRSCHTAKIGNYYVEGHVPAEDIKKMLSDASDINGLAVPGMPMGSPGMEGLSKDDYDVLAIQNDGRYSTYNSH